MTAAIVALGVVVALLGVLVVGLLRSHADVLRALHDLGVGENQLAGSARSSRLARSLGDPVIRTVDGVAAQGPGSALGRLFDVTGVSPDGGVVRVGLDGSRGTTLLAFLSTGCSTCLDFWRAFGTDEADRVPGDGTRIVVVTRGAEEESPGAVAELAPPRVTTVMSSQAWDDYDVPVAPYFMLVAGSRGVVGEGASASWAQVVDLLRKALADAGVEPGRAPRASRARWSRRDLLHGRAREERADRQLEAAEIEPGSPELYAPLHGPDHEASEPGQ